MLHVSPDESVVTRRLLGETFEPELLTGESQLSGSDTVVEVCRLFHMHRAVQGYCTWRHVSAPSRDASTHVHLQILCATQCHSAHDKA